MYIREDFFEHPAFEEIKDRPDKHSIKLFVLELLMTGKIKEQPNQKYKQNAIIKAKDLVDKHDFSKVIKKEL